MRFAVLDENGHEVTWAPYQRIQAGGFIAATSSFLLGGFALENADGSLTPIRTFSNPGPVAPGDQIYAPKTIHPVNI